MKTLGRQLWSDERGLIVSAELVLILTVVVLGLVTGLSCLQGALVGEYQDLSAAFGSLDQSYSIAGYSSPCTSGGGSRFKAWRSGSSFFDTRSGVGVTQQAARVEIGLGTRVHVEKPVEEKVIPACEQPCDSCQQPKPCGRCTGNQGPLLIPPNPNGCPAPVEQKIVPRPDSLDRKAPPAPIGPRPRPHQRTDEQPGSAGPAIPPPPVIAPPSKQR